MAESTVIFALAGLAVSAGTFCIGRLSAARSSGQEYGVMLTEIGYIKSGVDDMKRKMEASDKRYIDMEKRVTSLEEKMAIYHHGGNV